jgi:hypothetical protein
MSASTTTTCSTTRFRWPTSTRCFHYYRAAQMYFKGGDWNTRDVERVLDEACFPLRNAGSLREFAAGYGRLTRHFRSGSRRRR